MNRRGDVIPIYEVIIELAFLVAGIAMLFSIVSTAKESTLSEQRYLALEASRAQSAIALLGNAYYRLEIPGIPITFVTNLNKDSTTVGKVTAFAPYNTLGKQEPVLIDNPGSLQFEHAGRTLATGKELTQKSMMLRTGCVGTIPQGKIVFIPTSAETAALVTRLTAQNPQFVKVDDAAQLKTEAQRMKAFEGATGIVIVASGSRTQAIANAKGLGLACALGDAITPLQQLDKAPTFQSSIFVSSKEFLIAQNHEQLIPSTIPGVVLRVTQFDKEIADKLYAALI